MASEMGSGSAGRRMGMSSVWWLKSFCCLAEWGCGEAREGPEMVRRREKSSALSSGWGTVRCGERWAGWGLRGDDGEGDERGGGAGVSGAGEGRSVRSRVRGGLDGAAMTT